MKTSLSLCILFLCLACSKPTSTEADYIKIAVTRLTFRAAVSWEVIDASYRHCKRQFDHVMPVKLRIVEQGEYQPSLSLDTTGDQLGLYWSLYSNYPYPNTGYIWLTVALLRPGMLYGGYASVDSYKNPDMNPLALVWLTKDNIYWNGEVICHEICHTLSFRHKHGYHFSEASIATMIDYLDRVNRTKIRTARKNYRTARHNGLLKKAAKWKRIWKLRKKRLFTH